MNWIDDLHDKVVYQMRRESVSYETKQYANHRIREIRADLDRVMRKNAYEDYLLRELDREREKYLLSKQDGDADDVLEDTPYGEVREQPVCSCSGKFAHRCPLKRGKLPREIRNADDIDDGIREFRANHDGNPVVLDTAQDSWATLVGDVEHELRDLLAILASDEIPDGADWPAAPSANGQTAD